MNPEEYEALVQRIADDITNPATITGALQEMRELNTTAHKQLTTVTSQNIDLLKQKQALQEANLEQLLKLGQPKTPAQQTEQQDGSELEIEDILGEDF